MIHTPVCDLLRIRHPIVLGGMAGATSVPLVAAVSQDIPPAGEIVERIVTEAQALLKDRLPGLVRVG